jgi:hypothetical protein
MHSQWLRGGLRIGSGSVKRYRGRAIDQHEAGIDELLAGTIKLLIGRNETKGVRSLIMSDA